MDLLCSGFSRSQLTSWVCVGIGLFGICGEMVAGKIPALKHLLELFSLESFCFWAVLLSGILIRFFPAAISDTDSPDKFPNFFNKWKIELLILAITFLSLFMLINSGYYWDDAVNSTAYLNEKFDGIPLSQNILTFMHKYIELGRINVLSFYYYFWFYLTNYKIYKFLIIFTILLDQIFFSLTVFEITQSKKISQLGMLMIPLLIQIRPYQDPVNGFYGLMQLILLELLLTAFFLIRYLKTSQTRHLIFSLIPFFFGLMTYEVCFPFLLMIPLLIYAVTKNLRKSLRLTIPYLLIEILLLAAIFFIRSRYSQNQVYSGVAFRLDAASIIRTYFYQITASLPLSLYTAAKELDVMGSSFLARNVYPYHFPDFIHSISLLDFLIVLFSMLILWKILTEKEPAPASSKAAVVLGFCLWLLPGITIAVSQRYQGQLMPGLGYLPVYIQYFGISILLSILIHKAMSKKNNHFVCGFLFGFAAVSALINLQNNQAVTSIMNNIFLYPRLSGETALQSGIFSFLPENAEILSINPERYTWEANWSHSGLYREYYQNWSGKKLNAYGIYNLSELLQNKTLSNTVQNPDGSFTAQPDNLYVFSYNGNSENGLAKLGHVKKIRFDPQKPAVYETETDKVIYFISGNFSSDQNIFYVDANKNNHWTALEQKQQIRKASNGILCQIDPDTEIAFETLEISSMVSN